MEIDRQVLLVKEVHERLAEEQETSTRYQRMVNKAKQAAEDVAVRLHHVKGELVKKDAVIGDMSQRRALQTQEVYTLKQDLTRLQETLQDKERLIGMLESGRGLEIMTAKANELKEELKAATTRMKDREQRVAVLESTGEDQQTRMLTLEGEVDAMSAVVRTLEAEVARLQQAQEDHVGSTTPGNRSHSHREVVQLRQLVAAGHVELAEVVARMQTVRKDRDRWRASAKVLRDQVEKMQADLERVEHLRHVQKQRNDELEYKVV